MQQYVVTVRSVVRQCNLAPEQVNPGYSQVMDDPAEVLMGSMHPNDTVICKAPG
jgi:hypothetical protein